MGTERCYIMEPIPFSKIPEIFPADLAAVFQDSRFDILRDQMLADIVVRLHEVLKCQELHQQMAAEIKREHCFRGYLVLVLEEILPETPALYANHAYWRHTLEHALNLEKSGYRLSAVLGYFTWLRKVLDKMELMIPVGQPLFQAAFSAWHHNKTQVDWRRFSPARWNQKLHKLWFEFLTEALGATAKTRDCLGYQQFFQTWSLLSVENMGIRPEAMHPLTLRNLALALTQFFEELRPLVEQRFNGEWPVFAGGWSRTWFLVWLWRRRRALVLSCIKEEVWQRLYRAFHGVSIRQAFLWLPPFAVRHLDNFLPGQDEERYLPAIRHLARGGSPLTAPGLPISLTHRMAHVFAQADRDVAGMTDALRYAQVTALGGDNALFQEIWYALGGDFSDQTFWESVIRWFVLHAGEARLAECHGVLDYIRHQRREQGESFTMKGRSVAALVRRVETWHEREPYLAGGQYLRWDRWDIPEYQAAPLPNETAALRIVQLTNSEEMHKESAVMHHCVATYSHQCHSGFTSIWSLRTYSADDRVLDRHATIEVNQHRQIVQVRSFCNALPGKIYLDVVKEWGESNGLALLGC